MSRKTKKNNPTNRSRRRSASERDAIGSAAAAMRHSAKVVRSSLNGQRSASSEAARMAGSAIQATAGPLESAVKAVVGGTVGAVAGAISGVSEAVRQATGARKPNRRG